MKKNRKNFTKSQRYAYVKGMQKGYRNCIEDYEATGNIGQLRITLPKEEGYVYYTNGSRTSTKVIEEKVRPIKEALLNSINSVKKYREENGDEAVDKIFEKMKK